MKEEIQIEIEIDSDVVEEATSLLSYKLRELEQKTLASTTNTTSTSLIKKYNKMDSILESKASRKSDNSTVEAQDEVFSNELLPLRWKQSSTPIKHSRFSGPVRSIKSTKKMRNHTSLEESTKVCKPLNRRSKITEPMPLTFKFLKRSQKVTGRQKLLYEPTISSIFEIQGQGIILFSNGTSMEGFWLHGSPSGRLKIKYPNQSTYVGDIYNMKSHGHGQLTFASGSRYIGEFCYGQIDGKGKYYDPNGQLVRQGLWRRGNFLY